MNNQKVFRVMEIFWLIVAGIMAVLSVWLMIEQKFDSARMPLFATFAASTLFALRRYQRKRMEKMNGGNQTNQGKP
jgi:membrane protein implicated in regulation of membrane protease activity